MRRLEGWWGWSRGWGQSSCSAGNSRNARALYLLSEAQRRTRDFASRRFRYIPTNAVPLDLSAAPEALFTPSNIGPAYRFTEETRPVDAYNGEQTTIGFYGMGDWVLSDRARLIGGLRVEHFDQTVNTFDPFGLFDLGFGGDEGTKYFLKFRKAF